jgi:hypothetical protein
MAKKIFQGLAPKRQQELCETLETHPNIEDIHFNKEGEHFFNVYEHSGKQFGQITVEKIRNKEKNVTTTVRTPILKTLIVESASRDELLGGGAKTDNSKAIKVLTDKVNKLQAQLGKTKDVAKVAELENEIEGLKNEIHELE